MDRLACVDVRAFPLQLLLCAQPAWREQAAVVVERDAPGGRVRWANERARELGVLPGMTHAAALGLATELRAGVVDAKMLADGVASLRELLEDFSPRIETSASEPGVFWIDVAGLELFHPTLEAWGEAVQAALAARDFVAAIAIGFRRQATYAAARALVRKRLLVFADAEEELRLVARVPLARLDLEPEVRDVLAKFGVRNLADLARLPRGELFERYGAEVERWHRVAHGVLAGEFAPVEFELPDAASLDFEPALGDLEALIAEFEALAGPLVAESAARERATTSIELALELEGAATKRLVVATAAPRLELTEFTRLLRLRLERVSLGRGVERLSLVVRSAPARAEELRLFVERPRRDLAAAERVLAALRSTFGAESVVHARLVDRHLPEASFEWAPVERALAPKPRLVERAPLVRRIFGAPRALPPRERHEGDGWLLAGTTRGEVKKLVGPYALSGGWWKSEIRREYFFAELANGEWLWVFYDQVRRRWFWQGTVA